MSGVSAVADVSDFLDSVMKDLLDLGRGGETVGFSEAGVGLEVAPASTRPGGVCV